MLIVEITCNDELTCCESNFDVFMDVYNIFLWVFLRSLCTQGNYVKRLFLYPRCGIYQCKVFRIEFIWVMVMTIRALGHKNIERHIMHTIVSWPNPKQWVIVHTSDLMMIIRQSMYILSIITKGMGKLKTHSPTYCIMDNWDYLILLTHATNYIWQAF